MELKNIEIEFKDEYIRQLLENEIYEKLYPNMFENKIEIEIYKKDGKWIATNLEQ
ncbi:MAG: hypothetical protein PVF17_00815 [Ignavibacteria bacterium]|jgi:hypothetical protein